MSAPPPVYLDHAASTPVEPRVAAVMAHYLTGDGIFGNASATSHAYGREAAAHVAAARADVAALLGAQPDEIIFTAGATEADNLAIAGVARARAGLGRHLVTSRTEHKAVLDPCRRLEQEGIEVTWLDPGDDGRIDPRQVRRALRPDTLLVSIMHAHNETGVVQDIAAIAAHCRAAGVLLHSDAAQSAGKLPVDVAALGVDLLSISAHKFGGPKGVGALFVAARARPWVAPLLLGGGQERGLRPGTVATHQVAGLAAAARIALSEAAAEAARVAALRDVLQRRLAQLAGLRFNGASEPRLPGLLSVSVEGVHGESLVAALEDELALATGAACDSATAEPSYSLRALGLSPQLAQATLRISLGRTNGPADVDRAVAAIGRAVARLRAVAP